jgi:hypothetical protein
MKGIVLQVLATPAILLFLSCGGGGGGGGSSNAPLLPPAYNASGTWTISETKKPSDCPAGTVLLTYTVTVDQLTGSNNLTVISNATGTSYAGVMSGNTITYSGPEPDSDCPGGLSISVTITITSSTTLTGTASWNCNYGSGTCSGSTAFTGTRPSPGDMTAPSVPANLSVLPVSSSQIDLSWNPSTDDVGVTGYHVYRAGTVGIYKTVTGTSTSETGLSASRQYCYSVAAFDAGGNESAQCTQLCATTLASGDVTPPTVPTNLRLSAVSSSQINLAWNASSDNSGAVAGYKIYRVGASTNPVLVVNSVAASDTGLTASTNYCYSVAAYDAAGNTSANCAQVCLSTPALGAPLAPSDFKATALSSSTIRLTWTDNSNNETAFQIYETVGGIIPYTKLTEVGPGVTAYNHLGLTASKKYYYYLRAINGVGNSLEVYANATTQAEASTTQQFLPTRDNVVRSSNLYPAWGNTVYSTTELMVGNDFYYQWYGYDYHAAASLLYFNVSSTINGKMILRATLKLYPRVLPGDWNTFYRVNALIATWSGSTVTMNNCPNVYNSPYAQLPPPVTTALPMEWDVTALVQRWASGTWANNGFAVMDTKPAPDYTPALRMGSFDSTNVYSNVNRRPVLEIEYH